LKVVYIVLMNGCDLDMAIRPDNWSGRRGSYFQQLFWGLVRVDVCRRLRTSWCSDCVANCCVFWGVSSPAHGRVVGKLDVSRAAGAGTRVRVLLQTTSMVVRGPYWRMVWFVVTRCLHLSGCVLCIYMTLVCSHLD